MQVCHCVIRSPKMQMRKVPFAAVRDEHPWRNELPKEESPGPYEADSDDGVRGRSVARASASHLNDFSSSNIECVSAWNKDPVSGVIGVQTGPH